MRTSRAFSREATAVAAYVERCRRDPHVQLEHCLGAGAVGELEQRLAALVGKKFCVATSSATAALMAIPYALNCRRGEFITTPATYGATVAGWLFAGARPRFADIDPRSLTLDPQSVRKRISSRTKAIVAVDLFGTPSDDEALRAIAADHGLRYVADASQALGALRHGRHASQLADVLVISFTAGKTVFAGEGGALLTDDREIYERLLFFTQHPLRQRRELGVAIDNEFGFNGRIHPLAAVWAMAALDRALQELEIHRERTMRVIEELNETQMFEPVELPRSVEPTFFRLTVARRKKEVAEGLQTRLRNHGLQVGVTPLPLRLLYAQASFLAQYGRRWTPHDRCSAAEEQWARRVCITPKAVPTQLRRRR